VIVAQPQSSVIPTGQSTTLRVTAQGAGLSYQWFGGDPGFTGAPLLGATHATLTVTPKVSSTYWVEVSNECGRADSTTGTITVK